MKLRWLMRIVADRRLWLGNPSDTANPQALFDAEIQAVVELADNEPPAILPRGLIRCRFPLSDGGDNAPWLLRLAADSVAALSRAGVISHSGMAANRHRPRAARVLESTCRRGQRKLWRPS